MIRVFPLFLCASLAVSSPVFAGGDHGDHDHHSQKKHVIAALSDEIRVEFMEGAGMGLARAAELNGWPGPLHVLEMAKDLGINADQKARISAIRENMKIQAQALGAEIVHLEYKLDQAFRSELIDREPAFELVREIGAKMGELRVVHLHAHMRTRDVLSLEQIAEYNHLRGYTDADHTHDDSHSHSHSDGQGTHSHGD